MKPDLLGGSPSKRRDRQLYSLREQKRRRVEDQEPEDDGARSDNRARTPPEDLDAGPAKRIKLQRDQVRSEESQLNESGWSGSTLAPSTPRRPPFLVSKHSSSDRISREDVEALYIVDDDFIFSTLDASVEHLYEHYETSLPLDRRRTREAMKTEVVHLLYSEEVKLVSEVGQRAALRGARYGSGLIKFDSRYVQYVPIHKVVLRKDLGMGKGIWWSPGLPGDDAP